MNAYVFTGPTLSSEEVRAELDAICLPPVSQGDVYRVACRRPRAIGIIDGYFECVPAVWHKEILWAMTQGIHVFGSASMGALRAAELASFGMEGVGRIFEAYRDGVLEDDDEVAVAHAPACPDGIGPQRGYQQASIAMVDIRATLAAAEARSVITPATRQALERLAKELFYAERTYEEILARAARLRVPSEELDAFRNWLPRGQVHQKREDALAMLRQMRKRLRKAPEQKTVRFSFEYTEAWERARRHAGVLHRNPQGSERTLLLDRLLDELRLEKNRFAGARQLALLRFLAIEEANRQGFAATSEVVADTAETLRHERQLTSAESFDRWLVENHLDPEQFTKWMEEEARLRWLEDFAELEISAHLLDHLRKTGEFPHLAARALDKEKTLQAAGLHYPALADTGRTQEELLQWYFTERRGESVPENVAEFARHAGFEDEDSFLFALVREFCYFEHRR